MSLFLPVFDSRADSGWTQGLPISWGHVRESWSNRESWCGSFVQWLANEWPPGRSNGVGGEIMVTGPEARDGGRGLAARWVREAWEGAEEGD